MAALVRHVHFKIAPGGGPHGYLHNLQRAVADHKADSEIRIEVTTLPPLGPVPGPGWLERTAATLTALPGLRRLNYEIQGDFGLRFKQAVLDWKVHYDAVDRAACEHLLACDLLVVHDTFLAERLAMHHPGETRRKVVLITHAPTFYAHQIAGHLVPDAAESDWREERAVRKLRRRELDAMQAVRAVAWPFPEAQEGYPEWHALARQQRVRNVFIRTGVPQPEPRAAREATRTGWGIAPEARVALFMGRAHPDKGFGRFLDWAESGSRLDWIFAFAGEDAKHLKRDTGALRPLGYLSDNGGAYIAADVLVIPNRQSYLDIGLLECLSLGVPVATTPVGGHREVLRLSGEAICAIPDGPPAEVWGALSSAAVKMGEPESRAARKEIWARLFSPESFVKEHTAAAAALLGDSSHGSNDYNGRT